MILNFRLAYWCTTNKRINSGKSIVCSFHQFGNQIEQKKRFRDLQCESLSYVTKTEKISCKESKTMAESRQFLLCLKLKTDNKFHISF